MAGTALLLASVLVATLYVLGIIFYRLLLDPIAKFPGPKIAGATFWYEFYYDVVCRGSYFREIKKMHEQYGEFVGLVVYFLNHRNCTFPLFSYSNV
jgi:hypothetical protein